MRSTREQKSRELMRHGTFRFRCSHQISVMRIIFHLADFQGIRIGVNLYITERIYQRIKEKATEKQRERQRERNNERHTE